MPSKFYADLHIHSKASDGTFSPAEVVSNAVKVGLRAISLTDHDTVEGVEEAIENGRTAGIGVIPGIEMGSDIDGHDIHILGYFVDFRNQSFLTYLKELADNRILRAEEMCAKLTAAGAPVTLDEAKSQAPGNVLTRAHIARAVVAKGHARSVTEAFNVFLGNGKSCFVPKYNLTSADVISSILKAGGVPVLAHPKLSKIDYAIDRLVEEGLQGIETYCLDHGPNDIKRYIKIAGERGLAVTGGSDCHGPHTPGRFTMGSCGVDRDRFDALAERGKWNST